MTVIKIEVVSDFVCAWCYIGKRVLEQAISLYRKTYPGGKNDVFDITWRTYYLNYNPSPESVNKSDLAETKLADMSPEKREALTKRMERIGQSVGIAFKWGGKIGSTRDAHRIMHLSRSRPANVQSALVDGLYAAYNELEMDISDKEVLQGIATRAGLDAPEVKEWLASDVGAEAVDGEAKESRQRVNGSGVPTYFIQGVHRVDGAQDMSEFMEAFIKVREAESIA